MRTLAYLTLLAFLPGWLVAAPIPKPADDTTDKLLGTWRLTKSDAENAGGYTFTIEFLKDGKLKAQYVFNDSTQTIEGTFKADRTKIEYTLGDRGETLTIDKITDKELVVTDPEKKKEEFERVKAEK